MTFHHPKKPCAECPWRRDVAVGRFTPDRYRALANTGEDMAMRLFACHKTPDDKPLTCAGFLLRGGDHNLTLRLAYCRGEIVPESVGDGGYPLYRDYREMAVANGVDPRDPALARVRESSSETKRRKGTTAFLPPTSEHNHR